MDPSHLTGHIGTVPRISGRNEGPRLLGKIAMMAKGKAGGLIFLAYVDD